MSTYNVMHIPKLVQILISVKCYSDMSAALPSEGPESTKSAYPSVGLGNSFAFKFEDLKGRVHRLNCGEYC